MIKRTFIIMLTICFIVCMPYSIAADDSATDYITSKTVSENKNNVKISGSIPVVKNLTNPMFQYKVNAAITDIYDLKTAEAAERKVRLLKFSHDSFFENGILSVIVYSTNVVSGETVVRTVVVNTKVNAFSSINGILGGNGIKYAKKTVENAINNDKKIKYTSDANVDEYTPFYFRNRAIVVMFNAGEITYVSKGVRYFSVPASNMKNAIIPSSQYYVKSSYNVKMIPLRQTVESFGYTVGWDAAKGSITVNGNDTTSLLTPGKNNYIKNKISKRLEFAPEIKNGITYVPISYFEEVLDMLFSVDNNGNVTITKYSLQ
ncbi:MAG: copper amine oxidase N-terminal domain-containing protein [Firmicutes bacterium]|nr:copper amine oxidase N-terminal domain-containing protein [Bacillota bacterium]